MIWVGVLQYLQYVKDAQHYSHTFQEDHWLRVTDLVEDQRKRKSKQVQNNVQNFNPCYDIICSFRNSNFLKIAQGILTVLYVLIIQRIEIYWFSKCVIVRDLLIKELHEIGQFYDVLYHVCGSSSLSGKLNIS